VHQIANPLNLLDVFGGGRNYQFNKINGLGVKSDRLLADSYFLLVKPTPHNGNHANDRFSKFNKKRDVVRDAN
jgi:hypothetical protein